MNVTRIFSLSALALSMNAIAIDNFDIVPLEDGEESVFGVAINKDGIVTYLKKTDTFHNSFILDGSETRISGFSGSNEDGSPNTNVNTFVTDLNDQGMYIGGAMSPLVTDSYMNDDGVSTDFVMSDFYRIGFVVKDGITKALPRFDDKPYVFSQAMGLSENNTVAGITTVGYSDGFITAIDLCEDDEARGTQPLEACISDLIVANGLNINTAGVNKSSRLDLKAAVWQEDEAGEWNTTIFEHLGALDEGDDRVRYSYANDVNNDGVAVGQSETYYLDLADSNDLRYLISYPAIFTSQETQSILDQEAYLSGEAVTINNSGLIAGYGVQRVSGIAENIFFTYDLNTEEFFNPTPLFAASSTKPLDINSDGFIVGFAESDPNHTQSIYGSSSPSSIAAILYDSNQPELGVINLNERVACNSGYTLARAVSIDSNNNILVDAVVSYDSTDSEGNVTTVERITPVKLVPNSDAAGCPNTINTDGNSGSIGLSACLLMLSAFLRRRTKLNLLSN